MAITPNMNLIVPTVQVTVSPDWAQDINDSLDLIDAHDHTPGKGVSIPTAGITIDADLSLNSFNLSQIRALRLDNQNSDPSDPADIRIVYSKTGELIYKDGVGNVVPITAGGSVAAAAGSITGLVPPASAVYSSGTKTIQFLQDTSKPAKLAISDILLYEFNNATANPITIKSPASIVTSYDYFVPPAVPAAMAILYMDPSGATHVIESAWQDFTPTINRGNIDAATKMRWRRIGSSMEIQGTIKYNGSGAGGSKQSFLVPLGLTIDTTVFFNGSASCFGEAFYFDAAGSNLYGGQACIGDTNQDIAFNLGYNITDMAGSRLRGFQTGDGNNNDTVSISCSIPILEWI